MNEGILPRPIEHLHALNPITGQNGLIEAVPPG